MENRYDNENNHRSLVFSSSSSVGIFNYLIFPPKNVHGQYPILIHPWMIYSYDRIVQLVLNQISSRVRMIWTMDMFGIIFVIKNLYPMIQQCHKVLIRYGVNDDPVFLSRMLNLGLFWRKSIIEIKIFWCSSNKCKSNFLSIILSSVPIHFSISARRLVFICNREVIKMDPLIIIRHLQCVGIYFMQKKIIFNWNKWKRLIEYCGKILRRKFSVF
jgi:hypothetical protein